MLPVIPGVVLETEIGRGGFAAVYRGRQQTVDRAVAVKVDTRHLTDPRDLRRFLREVQAAGRVSAHPNIVTVLDAGATTEQQPYLVMEYCPGGSYAQRMRSGPISVDQALTVGASIADGLQAAHEQGILHRDIKPGNILITQYGTAALADFGLATLPRGDGEFSATLEALTPAYAAPEAFELGEPTRLADIYSLGATVYALMRGSAPRSEPDGSAPSLPKLLAQLHQPLPALPDLDEVMVVLWKATHPDPAQRYQSAASLRDALVAVLRRLPGRDQQTVSGIDQQYIRQLQLLSGGATGPGDGATTGSVGDIPAGGSAPATKTPRRSKTALVIAATLTAFLAGAVVLMTMLSSGRRSSPIDATTVPSTPPGVSAPVVTGEAAVASGPSPSSDATSPNSLPTTSTGVGPGGQCFNGLVNIAGVVTAGKLDCAAEHYW